MENGLMNNNHIGNGNFNSLYICKQRGKKKYSHFHHLCLTDPSSDKPSFHLPSSLTYNVTYQPSVVFFSISHDYEILKIPSPCSKQTASFSIWVYIVLHSRVTCSGFTPITVLIGVSVCWEIEGR